MIRCTARLAAFAIFAFAPLSSSPVFAQKKIVAGPEDAQALAFEVAALQTLHRLDLTDGQLESLQRSVKGAASPMKASSQTKVTPAFVKSLTALRDALLQGDEDKIDDLKEKTAELMDKDKIQIDDRVAISDAARRGATQVIRSLQPNQVLAYLQVFDEDEVDLHEQLDEALERGGKMTPNQWKALRDQVAADSAWLLAGGEETRNRAAVKMLTALLDQHHGARKSKTTVPDLEKQVLQMTSSLDPFIVLRNAMERDIAEMLSNPRLPGAIQHTLEQRRKLAAK